MSRVVLAALVAPMVSCGAGDSPADLLRAAAARSTGSYGLRDRADSPGLQSCVNGLDPVDGIVDSQTGTMVLSRPGTQSPAVVVADGAVFVRGELLVEGDPPTDWFEIPADVTDEFGVALERSLGPVLARYVLAGGVASGPDELADAAAEHGTQFTVSRVDGSTRIEVGFGDGAQVEQGGLDLTEVRLRFDIDAEGRVDAVHATTADAGLDDLGFQLTFDWGSSAPVVPDTGDAVLLTPAMDLRDSPIGSCSIGG